MNDRQRRIYEAALRTLAFITAYFRQSMELPVIVEMKEDLTTATEALSALSAVKVTKTGASRDKTIHRGDARDHLFGLMQNIAGMWRRIAVKISGDVNKFRTPYGSDQDILASAESFAAQVEPLKIEFTKRAFDADFIEKLQAATSIFRETVNESETARRERVGTNAAFDEHVKICKMTIDDLDPIVKMKFRDNPQILAEWLVASHIARPAKREKEEEPQDSATT